MAREKFSQNFWGADFTSTLGFDALVKRLKEGKQMCLDFEECLEKRVKIEKQYGEDMLKLSRLMSGKDECGTLRRAWEQLKTETETSGRLHLNLSQRLSDEVFKSNKDFRNQQKDIRKKGEDTVRRAQTHKKNCSEKNNRMRSQYEGKCREADKAEESLHRLETNPLTKTKDLTQAHRKMEGAKAASNNSDQQYQECVKTLEEARVLWEREMEFLCQQFQELEEQRIAFLRHQLWSVCNYCSQACVEDDEAYEKVRKSLELCDVDEDIDLFVRERSTGADRPAQVLYENYYNPRNATVIPGVPTLASTREQPHKELPPIPPDDDIVQTSGVGPPVESMYSTATDLHTEHMDAHYSVPRVSDTVIALYDYVAQGQQELNLEEGDIVKVIGKEDTVWWCGQLKDKIGMFPATYVESYNPK